MAERRQARRPAARRRTEKPLTVAITGPTGDIGRSVVRALERSRRVGRIIGMARRPFDPREHGWKRTEYRRGDVLDRASVEDLVADADVIVHLAFIIFGGHDETHHINLDGSRNVFEVAVAARTKRLVYTSSVAAYGFHDDNPDVLTEDVPTRGTSEFYYSAQKAELEALLDDVAEGSSTQAYVLRPCIVAGRDAPTMVEAFTGQMLLGERMRSVWRVMDRVPLAAPFLPDTGTPFQLVHHDDVATAVRAAVLGAGAAGTYNIAGNGTVRVKDVTRALGWRAVPIPRRAVDAAATVIATLPLVPVQARWINALRKPVLMDTTKARRQLRWRPAHGARETLKETVESARAAGLV